MAKKNFDPYNEQQYRNIHSEQQHERGALQQKISPTSRIVVAIVLSIILMITTYAVTSFILYGKAQLDARGMKAPASMSIPDGAILYNKMVSRPGGGLITLTVIDMNLDGKASPDEIEQYGFENPSDAEAAWRAMQPERIETEEEKALRLEEERVAAEMAKRLQLAYHFKPTWIHVVATLLSGLFTFLIMYQILMRNLKSQNMLADTSDINQWTNDAIIQGPDRIQKTYDFAPDAGYHFSISPSSILGHYALKNKGLKTFEMAKRYDKNQILPDGTEVFKGDFILDENDEPIMVSVPAMDTEFMEKLFDSAELPKRKDLRLYYDATKIPYNPGGENRDKLKYDTWADVINNDWELPYYEPQRAGGAYIVDTAPVNTMILAITRAGKGQTIIEPMLDIWTREKRQNNVVTNDPKGELLRKFYVKATVRGYTVVQFNLINAMKTDIYNPLGLAAESAREGDFTKTAMYVENIANVFFPVDGADDPVWPNAANNAFKRAAYGLIDFYLEEEKEMRLYAERVGMEPKVLETKLDRMWGKVTLYNAYQLFVQLTSKKLKNPAADFAKKAKAGAFDSLSDDEYDEALKKVENEAKTWEEAPELDLLSLYFNATDRLPRNTMRNLIGNVNNSLRTMAGAEKMMASVYGIALTAMSFFTDPTISTLTSGTPSQNVDMAGISFPRRLGVRFHSDFVKANHLAGLQVKWDAFADENFEVNLGKAFEHEDLVSREGWARYYFDGIFPEDKAYVRLRLLNPRTGMLVRTFYFMFTKGYQTSLDGSYFMRDPILDERIIKDGILQELKQFKKKDGTIVYRQAKTTFKSDVIKGVLDNETKREKVDVGAIIRMKVGYVEKPKMIFLVTPPHLMKYAKLILILIKQLVDLNFDQSYMTKEDQKPLYKTRFMLDELGNLQSEGHGIDGFNTTLSIGLGQDQQFTLVLQTLQQLLDVYGDSANKIIQGNCHPLDSVIYVPDGTKQMKDMAIGDEVLLPSGGKSVVDGVYPQGVRSVFEVILRDGSKAKATSDHLWEIERYKTTVRCVGVDATGKRHYVGTGKDGKTAELVREVITTAELKERVEKGRQINLPRLEPLEFTAKDLPIEPYVLGALLGDGTFDANGGVTLCTGQPFLIDKIRSFGYDVNQVRQAPSKTPVYYVKGLGKLVRALGLVGKRSYEKFIPKDYLYGSVEQRVALLQGLMDTDGTISHRNEMEYSTASELLARDVQQLIRSLGGRVSIHVKDKVMYTSPNQMTPKQARPAYRLQNIRLHKLCPFSLPRKASRWHERDDNSGNRVVAINYLGEEAVQCISIQDERHLYIVDEYLPTHNTSNIIFLKSTDDSMIDTLTKMSGVTHKSYVDSKTITRDMGKLMMQNEGKASYTMTTKEVPLIAYNDLAFLPMRNSIVFRAGDPVIWNRNDSILPMSYALFKNTIIHPGHEYTLQTIPTLSTALDFDVRGNQPNFKEMLNKRMGQAVVSEVCQSLYSKAYGYEEYDIQALDPDNYADDIMELINQYLHEQHAGKVETEDEYDEEEFEGMVFGEDFYGEAEDNTKEQRQWIIDAQKKYNPPSEKGLYARGLIAPAQLVSAGGAVNHSMDRLFIEAYLNVRGAMEKDDEYFTYRKGTFCGKDGTVYIRKVDDTQTFKEFKDAMMDEDSRVFSEEEGGPDLSHYGSYQVTDAFYKFLASLPNWRFADGKFDQEVYEIYLRDMETSGDNKDW